MEQFLNYGDQRNEGWCIHCGGVDETRDHVPSRILLDEPYPTNLPVVAACQRCNLGCSLDEEYVACLLECPQEEQSQRVFHVRRLLAF